MVGRGGPGGAYPAQPSESEQLQILADAGISAEDVDLVVRDRLRWRHETAREDLEVLRAGQNALYRHAEIGDDVPERDRSGKGAKTTDTDLLGAWRTLAAAMARVAASADAEDTTEDFEQTRRNMIGGMCRSEADGKHADNLRLIEMVRRPRGGGHIGGGR